MKMFPAARHALAGATALALLGSTSAFALEGKALFDKAMEKQAFTIAYDGVEENGASFTLTGVTFTGPNGGKATAESLAIDNLRDSHPSFPEFEGMETLTFMDAFRLDGFQVMGPQSPVFTLADVDVNVTYEGRAMNFAGEAKGMNVDMAAAPGANPQGLKPLQDLGYATLSGGMTIAGSYDAESGRLAVTDSTMTVNDLASLNMTYAMTGYTPEIVKKANELAEADVAAQKAGQQPNPMAMMSVLGQLNIESAAIILKDDSGTKKILDYVAKQQGSTGAQLAAGVPFIIAAGMGQLGMPELTQQVSTAVGSFLQNPGTLTIAAKPAQPVPMMQVFGAAQQSPKAAVDMLNVSVTATN